MVCFVGVCFGWGGGGINGVVSVCVWGGGGVHLLFCGVGGCCFLGGWVGVWGVGLC